ncbi:MAG: adenylosuccinate lyase [Kiritimatiellaeota bacterium]|nr:adenylosuccinate lyase [Kiritimatiellota bacterium]
MNNETYQNPLTTRYAGKAMQRNWSPQKKHSTWRRLWLALAESERELGLDISEEQLEEMRSHLDDIDFSAAARIEAELRHDVMSHVHLFAELCPKAKPIIHLGATSCFVTDNAELIQIREAMRMTTAKLARVAAAFAEFAEKHKNLPVLGFTHYQPAQLTTLGKRFSLYTQDFIFDLRRLEFELESLPFRSVKGTTGTQASFLELFDGDIGKVLELERKVAEKMGFDLVLPVSGQTYTRKIDFLVLSVLSGIAQSAYKFAGDLRLSANLKELEEPFGSKQIGSSAMAYKRNPMRSERVCSLARYVISLPANAANTHATQWFERTLDDSANRRISLPEAFLGVDAILTLLSNIIDGIIVWPKMMESRIKAELPFMATENILMAAVKAGGDRQELHEAIRVHSMEAARQVKEFGKPNDLLERIEKDPLFAKVADNLGSIMNPSDFIGLASEQVDAFLANEVEPVLERYAEYLDSSDDEVTV